MNAMSQRLMENNNNNKLFINLNSWPLVDFTGFIFQLLEREQGAPFSVRNDLILSSSLCSANNFTYPKNTSLLLVATVADNSAKNI
jgi:hypothetical protein